MTRKPPPAVLGVCLSLVALAVGCDGGATERAASDESIGYRVRGVVRFVEDDSLQIRHQAIPDFRDPSGVVVGMEAMSMDFALAPGVSTEGVEAGDKVEFELRIDRDAPQPAVITAVEVLQPDTVLKF